jgi:hypothetical protein
LSSFDSDSAHFEYRREINGATRAERFGEFSPTDIQRIKSFLGLSTEDIEKSPVIDSMQRFPSPFFTQLSGEINNAHSWHLYTSTYMCLRKLIENLVIELLRKKFDTADLDMYYRAKQHRFHDFSLLIKNLENEIRQFEPYSQALDQRFFDFLRRFRERANSAAHSIDILQDFAEIDGFRDEMNHYISLMCDIIRKI